MKYLRRGVSRKAFRVVVGVEELEARSLLAAGIVPGIASLIGGQAVALLRGAPGQLVRVSVGNSDGQPTAGTDAPGGVRVTSPDLGSSSAAPPAIGGGPTGLGGGPTAGGGIPAAVTPSEFTATTSASEAPAETARAVVRPAAGTATAQDFVVLQPSATTVSAVLTNSGGGTPAAPVTPGTVQATAGPTGGQVRLLLDGGGDEETGRQVAALGSAVVVEGAPAQPSQNGTEVAPDGRTTHGPEFSTGATPTATDLVGPRRAARATGEQTAGAEAGEDYLQKLKGLAAGGLLAAAAVSAFAIDRMDLADGGRRRKPARRSAPGADDAEGSSGYRPELRPISG